jgi:hypothetical protein
MGRRPGDQARAGRRLALVLLPALALGACSGGVPRDIDPRIAVGNLFGAHLAGREPPPGLDQPYPNLASVPARPEPPDRATRGAISGGLAEDRERSREPVTPTGARAFEPGAGPPPPARIAAVPPVRIDPPPRDAAPAGQPAQAVPQLTAPPAAPAPELLAPPPAPAGDLLAPPPPPAGDLLAPRGG